MGMTIKLDASKKIELCGDTFEGEVDGLKVFMNHYPLYTELALKSGDYDLCVCGHTHEYREEKMEDRLLVNPGEIQGFKTGKPCFVIFDTSTKKVRRFFVNKND